MIDEENKIKEIVESLINFTFEFDIEQSISKLELKEVSGEELKELGSERIRENFKQGIFKIKLPNEKVVDIHTIDEYCNKNNISNPIVSLSPEQKYVRYDFNEDLTTKQIKKHIRNKIATSNDLNLDVLQKTLVTEKLKNKPVDGFIHGIGFKTSNSVKKGKMYMQSSCNEEYAYEQLSTEINAIKIEEQNYIEDKIRKGRLNLVFYIIFILTVLTLWILNNNCATIPNWLSTSIGITLFLVSFIVMRFINHSAMKLAFNRRKAIKEFRNDFFRQLADN